LGHSSRLKSASSEATDQLSAARDPDGGTFFATCMANAIMSSAFPFPPPPPPQSPAQFWSSWIVIAVIVLLVAVIALVALYW